MTAANFIILCPSCGLGNRIPADKEGIKGHCGSCKGALPPLYYRPQQISDRTFDGFVNSYPEQVLAEFWAPW